MGETFEFSSREIMQTGLIPTENSERRPFHNLLENQILTFLWRIGHQEQPRTVENRCASSVVSERALHLVYSDYLLIS